MTDTEETKHSGREMTDEELQDFYIRNIPISKIDGRTSYLPLPAKIGTVVFSPTPDSQIEICSTAGGTNDSYEVYLKGIIGIARAVGHKIPKGDYDIQAAQIFFADDGSPEEIRYTLCHKGSGKGVINSPVLPRIEMANDRYVTIHPDDKGRSHCSMIAFTNPIPQAVGQARRLLYVTCENLKNRQWEAFYGVKGYGGEKDYDYTPSPFAGGELAKIATGAPVRTSSMAMTRADLWIKDAKGLPFYSETLGDGTIVTHCVIEPDRLDEECKLEELTGRAWGIVNDYGIETGFINLLFSAYAAEASRPWREPFTIKGTNILKDLGWDTKKKNKSEMLRKLYVLIKKNICSLNTGGIWKIGSEKIKMGFGKHWDLRWEEFDGQATLLGDLPDPMTEFWIKILPGEWTNYFLNQEGHKHRTALHHFGYIARKAIQISPGHYPVAARLAIYLTTMVKDKPMTFKVETLLGKAVSDSDMQSARSNTKSGKAKRYDIKKQWDEALRKLREVGYKIDFGESYAQQLKPDWAMEQEEITGKDLRPLPKNYWNPLMAATVVISSPQMMAAPKGSGLLPEPPKAPDPGRPLTGGVVRELRTSKKMTIAYLAKAIGISSTMLKYIEAGTRTITPAKEEKLRIILGIGRGTSPKARPIL